MYIRSMYNAMLYSFELFLDISLNILSFDETTIFSFFPTFHIVP